MRAHRIVSLSIGLEVFIGCCVRSNFDPFAGAFFSP